MFRNEEGQVLLAGNGRTMRRDARPVNEYQYPPREQYRNPLLDTLIAAEELLSTLDSAAERLEIAIAADAGAKAAARAAKETLAERESEYVVEWTIAAAAGDGPLAGVAKTSKGYTHALDNALAAARRNGLRPIAADAERATVAAMNTEIELQSAQARYRAYLAAAELRSAVLHARTRSNY